MVYLNYIVNYKFINGYNYTINLFVAKYGLLKNAQSF